ncbi:amino acid transporter-like protein [Pseudovirgaria hyperparasitica]|uniref:Amino acid transporter-like protein n=1 Tax=Pseudovirgaria hyperparasitica TaxID=470096 RepID=A0A6A6WCR6_9PEZI|nr:amino acid transporter-like protein [Pseudovirgaria hyperparasitica]KAF2759844.1 amino acid transporter-like protein [Pseudovirgaria hyperparasitica]
MADVPGGQLQKGSGDEREYVPLSLDVRDNAALTRLGKKAVLKRKFGFMSILGFSCTILITWEGFLALFNTGYANGGPAGVIYGYLLVWAGTFSTFVTLSEMASMAPTSGGQYHWVAMLAPESCQQFLSYTTGTWPQMDMPFTIAADQILGWLTVLGWQTVVASTANLAATMIQGIIILSSPTSYAPKTWHAVLLYFGCILYSLVINTAPAGILPKFESSTFILHSAGFFAILIPLVIMGPHGSASDVFLTFKNGGNWPTQGVSFFVGLMGNVFAFFGADGAIHMCEEIKNAQIVVPRSILTAIGINGSLGFAIAIAALFCIGEVELTSPTGYGFMEIFLLAVKSRAGAAAMSSLIALMMLHALVGIMASASRLLWSFSRDRMIPGWRYLEHINPRTSIPLPAVATTAILACLQALIILGSTIVFTHIVSLAVAAIFASYLIVTALFLWRRLRGDIYSPNKLTTDPGLINIPGSKLTWGPWRFNNLGGTLNNIFCVAYIGVVFFFSFWPSQTPVAANTMNYSCLMLGGTMIFSTVYYVVYAHKAYRGPIVEV